MTVTRAPGNGLEVRKALDILHPSDSIWELRMIRPRVKQRGIVLAGLYDDPDAFVASALEHEAESVCVNLHRLGGSLEHPVTNRLSVAERGSCFKPEDIDRLRFFFIDVDPKRNPGTGSTDEEKAMAEAVALSIRDDLCFDRGFPDPAFVDSGNGYHLLYGIDLPTKDSRLLKRALRSLNRDFGNEAVAIDIAVHDPGRIIRLPGTRNCKGLESAERPHRVSRIISAPDQVQPVFRDRIVALGGREGARQRRGRSKSRRRS